MKTLITKRLTIQALSKQDFSEIVEMYLEPDSNKYIRPLKGKTEKEYYTFLEKKLETNKTLKGQGFWICRSAKTGEFIGTCNLNPFFETNRIQIGCHLGMHYWNMGYASEIMQELIRYGNQDLDLTELYGFFEAENIASGKLLQKNGFHFFRNESHFDISLVVYRIQFSNQNPISYS